MHLPTVLDQKFRWLAIPGLIRIIAMLQAVFFVVMIFNPQGAALIAPAWDQVLRGEVWRIFSYVLYPPVPPTGGSLVFPAFFMLISVWVSFLISDTLEQTWGETRVTLFVLGLILCQGFILPFVAHTFPNPITTFQFASMAGTGYQSSIFFAFATVAPHYTFLLFMILPVKVWILAAISGVLILAGSLNPPILLLATTIIYLPYLIWAVPLFFRSAKTRRQVSKRRNKFVAAKSVGSPTLHLCKTCGKTENDDPEAEFRVAPDGDEYCLDHLP